MDDQTDTEPLYASIGTQIQNARRRRGITQHQLAEAVDLTRASITNAECGRQRLPVHTLIAIAQALDLDPADLITRALEGIPPVPPLPPGTAREAKSLEQQLLAARAQLDHLITAITGATDA